MHHVAAYLVARRKHGQFDKLLSPIQYNTFEGPAYALPWNDISSVMVWHKVRMEYKLPLRGPSARLGPIQPHKLQHPYNGADRRSNVLQIMDGPS